MPNRLILAVALAAAAYAGYAFAQYPILGRIADKVIAKYQNASCEQLWQQKSEPKSQSPEEQRVVGLLHSDPQMQAFFLNKVAAPIVNKMFSCGLIP